MKKGKACLHFPYGKDNQFLRRMQIHLERSLQPRRLLSFFTLTDLPNLKNIRKFAISTQITRNETKTWTHFLRDSR